MELLKLLLFSSAYTLLSYENFIILLLSTLVIRISSCVKIEFNVNNMDPRLFIVNIINIICKLISLQLNYIYMKINNNYIGSLIIKGYNHINLCYYNIRIYIFKLLCSSNNKLTNKKDINTFLDSL